MQVMFVWYHYFAAKEWYNWIRIYIAAYVWMTGFGMSQNLIDGMHQNHAVKKKELLSAGAAAFLPLFPAPTSTVS